MQADATIRYGTTAKAGSALERAAALPVLEAKTSPHPARKRRGGGFVFFITAHRHFRGITAHHCRAAREEAERASSSRLFWRSGEDDASVAARWGQRAPPLVLFLSG
jgi:hypothetical protein